MEDLRKGTLFSSANLANSESSVINPKDLAKDKEPQKYYSRVKRIISEALRQDEHSEKSYMEIKDN